MVIIFITLPNRVLFCQAFRDRCPDYQVQCPHEDDLCVLQFTAALP
jgi:hypothetical protein